VPAARRREDKEVCVVIGLVDGARDVDADVLIGRCIPEAHWIRVIERAVRLVFSMKLDPHDVAARR
jgi:hypothetical protein